jgi:biopolymer transport protein ExbD
MSWKIRHEGSPKAVENLTLDQIIEGLQDGLWEVTDEVMGPTDTEWVAIENHPKLEEIAIDVEPPQPKRDVDESRLDMTPLIDVCLVLLIFMVLTISYGAIQKQLDAAQVAAEGPKGQLRQVKDSVAKQTMIIVKATMENDKPVIRVEDKVVPEEALAGELRLLTSRKPELLIEWGPGVRRKTIVVIQDAAAAAQIQKIYVQAPKDMLNQPAPPPPIP